MAGISAADVMSLRQRTGLPMMDCKQALQETDNDPDAAVQWLRKRGVAVAEKRGDRETAFGRFGIFADFAAGAAGLVELQCESAPVAQSDEFIQLANDLAQQLAQGPGATSADELLDQPSPSKKGMTLREQKDEMFNRIREVFKVGRFQRIDGPCGAYSHNAATVAGVLVEVEGGNQSAAKDVCMHIAAMRPDALSSDDLDPEVVAREREILRAAALEEGKPESIVDKMVEGRLRNFYAERALLEQPFVKEQKLTVGNFAKQNDMQIKQFIHWELGR